MKMQMIPPILNDTGDCCCQNCPQCNNCGCVPGGDGCICRGDKSGDSIESAITCDLTWKERQPNGKYKYYKVVSGSSQQNMPVVLPTASLTKRGVVQLTNELSDRQDLALTPKGAKTIKTELDSETAERIAKDADLQSQIDKEKADRAKADSDLSDRITQETADRKKADSALSSTIANVSNRVTSAESKADSAVSKANKAVTDVTSDGNATVTVTKADGTSKSFTINNVAHATTADKATNANHATSADSATKATNADHATVADQVKNLDTNQLGKVSLLSSRTGDGNWTLSNVVVNKPIFITHNAGTYPGGCHLTVVSGSNDLKTTHHFGTWAVLSGQLLTTIGAGACAIVVPTEDTVVIKVEDSSDDGDTLRAYQ